MNNKLKVVWICHFSNKEVRDRLLSSEIKNKNSLKSLLGIKINPGYSDFAPWVTNLIKEFESFQDIELHIIAPFLELKYFIYEFEMRGVFYHFFNPEFLIAKILRNILGRRKERFFLNRYFVKKLLTRIKPDIVNLIGTENPYYSTTVLDIKNIPVYVSAQTVYTNPARTKNDDKYSQLNWDIELKIHDKEKYFGCTGRMHRDLILQNKPDAIIFKMFFPIEKPVGIKKMPKIFDFVFFAGLEKKKGVEDLIDALAIVKKEKCNVKLNIIGRCSIEYMDFLIKKIDELKLKENVIFNDYFPIHSDLYQHIVQSRYAVLPLKLDIIASSVVEAILLDLPVVTYKTTGTPYLNKEEETVLLSEIGDIEMLANNMLKLLKSPELGKKLQMKAKIFVEREFDNTASAKRLVSNYRAVIAHFHHNQPIPEELLFNIHEFPVY